MSPEQSKRVGGQLQRIVDVSATFVADRMSFRRRLRKRNMKHWIVVTAALLTISVHK
jgi:hypothetical protein